MYHLFYISYFKNINYMLYYSYTQQGEKKYYSLFTKTNLEHTEKYLIYHTYSMLIRNNRQYNQITIEEMISEVIRFYNKNKKLFIEIFSDEEIEQLIDDIDLESYNYPLIHNLRQFFFCSINDMDNEDFSISLETKDIVLECLEYYKQNIVYLAMLKSWDGGIDPASVIRLQKTYEVLRNTVIKKL